MDPKRVRVLTPSRTAWGPTLNEAKSRMIGCILKHLPMNSLSVVFCHPSEKYAQVKLDPFLPFFWDENTSSKKVHVPETKMP